MVMHLEFTLAEIMYKGIIVVNVADVSSETDEASIRVKDIQNYLFCGLSYRYTYIILIY